MAGGRIQNFPEGIAPLLAGASLFITFPHTNSIHPNAEFLCPHSLAWTGHELAELGTGVQIPVRASYLGRYFYGNIPDSAFLLGVLAFSP